MYYFIRLWAIAMALFLAACGGGGGSSGTTPGGPAPGTPVLAAPASVEILASTTQLGSASKATATFTVVVKDASNQAIPNQTVTFSATSGNLSGVLPSPVTGPAGEAITAVTLSPGADQSNRDIVVTATAGAVSRSITVSVLGSSVTVAGDSALLAGASSIFTAKALDSSGRPVSGVTLTASSQLGNALAPKSAVTDTQGAATFTYTGTAAGQDVLSVAGLGATARTAVSVSADDFRFESPGAGSAIAVDATVSATVRFVSGGAPVVGRQVTFSSTRGSVLVGSALTDSNGRASTQITSSTSGPATVIAQAASAQITLPVVFVATTPASLVLQANPGAVPPNAAGTVTNQSALQATVRDPSGNPVTGKVVNFTALTDGSNGTISPGSGVTDANGSVVVQFVPGPLTTAANGVVIRASVQGTGVEGTTSLTVSGQALFISIASGNVISNLDVTTYQKQFRVYVTDANGAPAGNRVVNLSVYPDVYMKGALTFVDPTWTYNSSSPTRCANEDANRNGILDVGEDINHDGRLFPGLPIVVTPASVTTGSDGFATFNLQYGENYASWLDTTITARTSVGGTESVQTQRFFLEGLSSDYSSATVPPQSQTSPFGVATSCTSPN